MTKEALSSFTIFTFSDMLILNGSARVRDTMEGIYEKKVFDLLTLAAASPARRHHGSKKCRSPSAT